VLPTACSLPTDEAALILVRFYMSPPADPGGTAKKDGVFMEPFTAWFHLQYAPERLDCQSFLQYHSL